MVTKRTPTIDGSGKLLEKFLPDRLGDVALKNGIATDVANPASTVGAALTATFVRFEDQDGNPLPTRNVVIKVDSTTGDILDIVSEA
jgi:hypothetical protein